MTSIMTVLGPIAPADLGPTASHEHIFAASTSNRKDADTRLSEFDTALEELLAFKKAGGDAMLEVSTIDMGRDASHLAELSAAAGVKIIAATGFYKGNYSPGGDTSLETWDFLPASLRQDSIEELAGLFIQEVCQGVLGTNVRVGIIGEIGTSYQRILDDEVKVFRAAARANRETGVPISTHTSLGSMGREQVKILKEAGADLSHVLLSHMDLASDPAYHTELARQGVFLGFDTAGKEKYQSDARRVGLIRGLVAQGFEDQIVISCDKEYFQTMLDFLIKNATVIDGTGRPGYPADIGIQADRIVAIQDLSQADACEIISAQGMLVAPGFIDMHSHADFTLPISPTANSKIQQGVTFELVGNCGSSTAPIDDRSRQTAVANSVLDGPGMDWEWNTFKSYLDRLSTTGTSVNVGVLVGHGTIRSLVMGEGDERPTNSQLDRMKNEVRLEMQAGAFGLSTGLIYAPNVYAGTDEIAALARCAAEAGGIYTSHIRGEADTVLEAVDEAIEIGKRADIPVEISHLKAEFHPNWPKMSIILEKIEKARLAGLDVTADMYPYTACNTSLSALLPPWVHVGGKNALLHRLRNEMDRARLRQDLSAVAVHDQPGYWERTFISSCPQRPDFDGRHLQDLAAELGLSPENAVMDILIEVASTVEMIQFLMSDENVEMGLRSPNVMIGSDAEGRSAEGPLSVGKPHPRNYGTFPRVLGHYAREKKLFSLEEAVYKMIGLPAKKLHLHQRGLLKPGFFADVVIFDPETVIDRATFTEPHQYPAGIPYVFVNGEVVIREGVHTQSRPGSLIHSTR